MVMEGEGMINLDLIRKNPHEIEEKYKKREKNIDLTEILDLDKKRRAVQQKVDEKKSGRKLSELVLKV